MVCERLKVLELRNESGELLVYIQSGSAKCEKVKTRKKVEPPLKREKERAMTIPKMKPLRFTLSSLQHGQETKT